MSYRFALRPLWLLSHVFALGVVVAFVALGLWQLDRHDQRAARNAAVESPGPTCRRCRWPTPSPRPTDPDDLRFRRLAAEGTYGDGVLLVDNRSLGGLPGAWVLAPLELADGSALAVNRGFLFTEIGTVTRRRRRTATCASRARSALGGRRLRRPARRRRSPVGAACLQRDAAEEAFGADVLPVVVQRQVSEPAEPGELEPVPAPELDAGPHRSYAFQWFTFAAITAVVYGLILRRKRPLAPPQCDRRHARFASTRETERP